MQDEGGISLGGVALLAEAKAMVEAKDNVGSGLFMILSAHGFSDVVINEATRHDVSRIAAQVVSGIGFIGAGCIIFQKHAVRGLTTAAGLWVAAAIGMAAGAGMYAVATAATVMVIVCLELMNFLHHHVFPHHTQDEYDADEETENRS